MEDFAKSKKSKQYYFSNLKGGAGTLKSLTTTYKKKGEILDCINSAKQSPTLLIDTLHYRKRRARQGQD
jgi:hypothetical protein